MANLGRVYAYATVRGIIGSVPGRHGTAAGWAVAAATSQTVLLGIGQANGVATVSGEVGNVRQPGVAAGVATVYGYTNVSDASAHGFATVLGYIEAAYTSIAHATSTVITTIVIPCVSTADATSSVSTADTTTLVSTAHATSPVSGSGSHDAALVSTAHATEIVSGSVTLELVSTADATSVLGYLPLTLTLVSTANATSSVDPTFTAHATYVSTAHATSSISGNRGISLVSTADATSVIGQTTITGAELVSTADATSSVITAKQALVSLISTAIASSVISGKLTAHQVLISTANATSHIILDDAVLQALWLNPTTTAAVTWSGMPFESMVEVEGEMYAAGTDGIYRLENTEDDEGVKVAAEVRWDLLTLNTPFRHRPGFVLLGGAAAGPLNVRVTNIQGKFDYPTHLSKNARDSNLRAQLAKGLNSRYIRFSVTNPNGVHFSIADAQVEVIEMSRRIGGKHG